MDEREATFGGPATIAAVALGAVLVVGIIGAVVAWTRGTGVSSAVAIAYYVFGGFVFLAGSFPTGGFSLMRGRSRRRPLGGGAFALPSMLLGVLLLGLGVLFDVTHPF